MNSMLIRIRKDNGDVIAYSSSNNSTALVGREYHLNDSVRVATTKDGLVTGRVYIRKWGYGFVETFFPDVAGDTRYRLA